MRTAVRCATFRGLLDRIHAVRHGSDVLAWSEDTMRHCILGVWIVAVVDSAMNLSAAEQKKKAPAKDARVIKIPINSR